MSNSKFAEEIKGMRLDSERIEVDYFGRTLSVPFGYRYLATTRKGSILAFTHRPSWVNAKDERGGWDDWGLGSIKIIDSFASLIENWKESLMEIKHV